MVNLNTRFGRHVNRRLREERILWLTTVDAQNAPQLRPVWFHWDGRTVLISSQREKAKLRQISANPRVALNFNTGEEGGNVTVLSGEARILEVQPPPDPVKSYLSKYGRGIKSLDIADRF